MDVGYRASAVAVGAAAFNARVAAAADGILGPVCFAAGDDACPVRAVLHLADESDPELAALYQAMISRETNRHHGKQVALPEDVIERLHATARREGARLHAEMISEVRFPGYGSQDSGIDVHSLELIPADLVKLAVLRRGDVMAYLGEWGLGGALGSGTRERIQAGPCVAVVSTTGRALTDYARAGSATEAVWVVAQQCGLGVQPISPVFLYANDDADLETLSPTRASALRRLRDDFRELSAIAPDESVALGASVRRRARHVGEESASDG